jgi:NAD(P)-dependent dehydrogenase (short-subunit alcohol dehydrogenase family)
MDIGVLVNNVGVGYEYPEYFGQVPDDKVDALLRVNMESMTRVTRIVLPGMAWMYPCLLRTASPCFCFEGRSMPADDKKPHVERQAWWSASAAPL